MEGVPDGSAIAQVQEDPADIRFVGNGFGMQFSDYGKPDRFRGCRCLLFRGSNPRLDGGDGVGGKDLL